MVRPKTTAAARPKAIVGRSPRNTEHRAPVNKYLRYRIYYGQIITKYRAGKVQRAGGHPTYKPPLTNGQGGKQDEVEGVGSSKWSAAGEQEEEENSEEEGGGRGDPLEFEDALVEVFQ